MRTRSRSLRRAALTAIFATLFAVSPITSATAQPRPSFAAWLEALWPEAQALGVSRRTFDETFRGLTPDMSLPDLAKPGTTTPSSRGQAEFTRPPSAYLDRSYLMRLAKTGQALARHREGVAEGNLGLTGAALCDLNHALLETVRAAGVKGWGEGVILLEGDPNEPLECIQPDPIDEPPFPAWQAFLKEHYGEPIGWDFHDKTGEPIMFVLCRNDRPVRDIDWNWDRSMIGSERE